MCAACFFLFYIFLIYGLTPGDEPKTLIYVASLFFLSGWLVILSGYYIQINEHLIPCFSPGGNVYTNLLSLVFSFVWKLILAVFHPSLAAVAARWRCQVLDLTIIDRVQSSNRRSRPNQTQKDGIGHCDPLWSQPKDWIPSNCPYSLSIDLVLIYYHERIFRKK